MNDFFTSKKNCPNNNINKKMIKTNNNSVIKNEIDMGITANSFDLISVICVIIYLFKAIDLQVDVRAVNQIRFHIARFGGDRRATATKHQCSIKPITDHADRSETKTETSSRSRRRRKRVITTISVEMIENNLHANESKPQSSPNPTEESHQS